MVTTYDKYTQTQISADNQRRKYLEQTMNGKDKFTIAELYREFERENLSYINDLHREIGLMQSLTEQFPSDNEIKQFTEYFIRINLVEIEKLIQEVRDGRETSKEFSRIYR